MAITSACAVLASVLTAWVVLHWVERPAEPKNRVERTGSALTERSIQETLIVFSDKNKVEAVPGSNDPANAQLQLSAGRVSVAQVASTAAVSYDLVSALKPEFNNAYFATRTGVKRDLNFVMAEASRVQEALTADSITPDATAKKVEALSSALDTIILRLDTIERTSSSPTHAEASGMLKDKLKEIRATLP